MSSFYGDPTTQAWQAAKILHELQGRSSVYSMPFDELHAASGLSKKRLKEMLDEMAYALPATINRATITKGGITQVVVWPTAVVVAPVQQALVIKTPRAPSAPRKPTASPLTQSILSKVVATPGIHRQDLVAYGCSLTPAASEYQVTTAIGSLQQKGFLVSGRQRKNPSYTVKRCL